MADSHASPPLAYPHLAEADRGSGVAGALNHLGVEVFSGEEVTAAADRLTEAGLATFDETDTTCCFALQDKVWVHDPAGTPWEVYVVKDEHPANASPAAASLTLVGESGSACCSTSTTGC